tara:strand:+ start:459 stop:1760 length:1302 start_codon:yes stop_codon:yes gene_type:complete
MNEQKEQKSNGRKRLEYAVKNKCLPTWLVDTKYSTYEGKDVIIGYGKDPKDKYAFYSDLTAKNIDTGKTAVWKCQGLEDVVVNSDSDKLVTTQVKVTPQGCRTTIKEYLLSGLLHNARVLDNVHPQLRKMKGELVKCYGAGMFEDMEPLTKDDFVNFDADSGLEGLPLRKKLSPFGFWKKGKELSFKEIWKILTGRDKRSRVTRSYLIRESKNNELSKIIKENLILISKSKKKTLTEERNIVKSRFSVLSEGRNVKTKIDKNSFADDVITEMFELRSQGFETEVISEGLFDMLGGLFGAAGGGIGQIIKEKMATWIISKLGLSTDGYLSNFIIVAFGNLPLSDYGKLTDCKFLSDLITNSVVESIALNVEKKSGKDGVFMDLLRNIAGDYFKDSSVENKISGYLEGVLCPLMGGIKGKMKDAEEQIKASVVGV